MVLRCCDFADLAKRIKEANKKIIMFGAGAIGQVSAPKILEAYGLLEHVCCYIDNNEKKWGTFIETCNRSYEVKSPQYLNEITEHAVILLNISRFSDALHQIEQMACTEHMECYVMPMMMIHNYCIEKSDGVPMLSQNALIPKKLHYMWLGGNPLPNKLKKCIDSWKEYCPDYEIVKWDEDNYDIEKHPYMRQAFENGAYGFVPDYARLDILYNEGGFFLDTDVELRKNIDNLRYQQAFCGVEKWQIVNFGGLSGAVKGHPMIKSFLDSRETISFYNADGSLNKNTCGYYDTMVALEHGYVINGRTQCVNGMNIYASDYFHPFDYMSGMLNETDNTYSIHWFNGGWLDDNMKKANEEAMQTYSDLYRRALN